MGHERSHIAAIQCAITSILLLTTTVSSNDASPIPEDPTSLISWFRDNVKPYANRKDTIDSVLAIAEATRRRIKVRKDASGDFKTIKEAINSIKSGNNERVIVDIGPGVYNEKLKIDRDKPFVTFLGSPSNMPTLSFGGTANQYGTVYSATLEAEADYFVAKNIIIKNSAPRPDGKMKGAQAVALRIAGDKSAFYNCKFFGFQDTLCDDKGRHLFKDCFIEGTVDFIFGSGKSLYLRTELNVLAEKGDSFITAHARATETEDTGLVFVHCKVHGVGNGAYLGRAWTDRARVVFAYTTMSEVVHPLGWSNSNHPERDRSVLFGEYKCKGAGADPKGRAKCGKQLSSKEATRFLSLGFIEGSKWLLPPPK